MQWGIRLTTRERCNGPLARWGSTDKKLLIFTARFKSQVT
ncbi:uncharacterized protein CLUP02_10435 [Colletotrichum lupini]|uniref:Uncharacterized protein n=1 Tax=Colletotrichum lupini TaxID=145971 RepID=A0A9Q8WIS2_9PEZI|nr:uncharacterized protein CLUP02_10435 [Colletotrichum lupini]UQC84939.1 hypothetical protein CLUP02_10435 [Colletotrichum lupini]